MGRPSSPLDFQDRTTDYLQHGAPPVCAQLPGLRAPFPGAPSREHSPRFRLCPCLGIHLVTGAQATVSFGARNCTLHPGQTPCCESSLQSQHHLLAAEQRGLQYARAFQCPWKNIVVAWPSFTVFSFITKNPKNQNWNLFCIDMCLHFPTCFRNPVLASCVGRVPAAQVTLGRQAVAAATPPLAGSP